MGTLNSIVIIVEWIRRLLFTPFHFSYYYFGGRWWEGLRYIRSSKRIVKFLFYTYYLISFLVLFFLSLIVYVLYIATEGLQNPVLTGASREEVQSN
jgi:hypothetical protein